MQFAISLRVPSTCPALPTNSQVRCLVPTRPWWTSTSQTKWLARVVLLLKRDMYIYLGGNFIILNRGCTISGRGTSSCFAKTLYYNRSTSELASYRRHPAWCGPFLWSHPITFVSFIRNIFYIQNQLYIINGKRKSLR